VRPCATVRSRPGRVGSLMEVACGAMCGGGLVGALLGFAEVGDGFGERGEPDDQQQRPKGVVLGEAGVGGDDPGGVPEPVPGRGGCRDAPVPGAGGAVEPVRCLPQHPAVQGGVRSKDPEGVLQEMWALFAV